jgi:hypothetical protein
MVFEDGEVGLGEAVDGIALGVGDVDVDNHFVGEDLDGGRRGWGGGGRGLGEEAGAAEQTCSQDEGRGREGREARAHFEALQG